MVSRTVLAATLLLTTLVYWARAQGCSVTNAVLASNQVYTLTSINFPSPYPATTSYYCTFTGTAPADHKVFLQCDSFDVVYSQQCDLAWFAFSASGDAQFTDSLRYCGYYQTLSLQTTGNQFAAAFVNNYYLENNPYTGYRCYVVAIPNTPTTPATTTPASTTKAPTTPASTTKAPPTPASTTKAPTTPAPTTKAPTTRAPTTKAPTTPALTTKVPTTPAPTTKAPTTRAPTTKAPTTSASTTPTRTTKAPTTRAPTTKAPTTPAPTTKAPTTPAPTTKAPTTPAPTNKPSSTPVPTTKAPTTSASTTRTPTTKAPFTPVPTTPSTTKAPTTPPSTCICGIKNSGSRIVGGQATTVHEYPWMVALVGKTTGTLYCGGTLIDNQWVLTASHCLAGFQASDIIIRLGEHQVSSTTETNQTISRNASQIIVHENYNDVTVDNDIGLVKLSSPVIYSKQINPACLPLRFPTTQDFHGKNATVTGWGTTAYQGYVSDILQEITLPVFGNSQCNNTFPSVAGKLTANMFCTYVTGKDSCQGDSGGPLVYEEAGRNYLIGVVSWGIKCAENGNPGVYAKVNNYLDWMKQKTGVTFCNV